MRLILVDDHPIVLTGLDRLFSTIPEFHIVARCHTGAQAVTATRTLQPDLLLLDLKLPDMSGLDVLRTLKAEALATRIVLLTASMMPGELAVARQLGVDGVLYKDLSPNDLINGVRRAAVGLKPLPPDMPADTESAAAKFALLTAREREIVAAATAGHRNRVIAQRLGIAEGTVKLHLHNVYDKLGVDGRVELVLLARRAGVGV